MTYYAMVEGVPVVRAQYYVEFRPYVRRDPHDRGLCPAEFRCEEEAFQAALCAGGTGATIRIAPFEAGLPTDARYCMGCEAY